MQMKSNAFKKQGLILILLSMVGLMLTACGGGGGGDSGTASTPTGTPGTTVATGPGGTNATGQTGYSIYVQEGAVTQSGSTITSVVNSLLNYASFGTTATTPYNASSTSFYYNDLVSDAAGNLWAAQNSISSGTSTAIVKFPGANTNPATLTPTSVITLPSNVVISSMVFDNSGNLWVDQDNTNDTGASIVEYTAASSFASTGTTITYSTAGGVSGCSHANLAVAPTGTTYAGNLYAYEAFNSAGQCGKKMVGYDAAGTDVGISAAMVTTNWLPNQNPLAVDPTGNIWVASASVACSGCTSVTATLKEYSPDTVSGALLQTINIPGNPSGLGGENGAAPVFDSKGNLWFTTSTGNICKSGTVNSIYELPVGTTTPVLAYASSGSCNPFFGVAVTPVL